MALEQLSNNLRVIGGFELSLAEFIGDSFDVSSQDTAPRGITFNSDGTRMFVIGRSSDSVHQYSLSTGFDIGTASFSGTSFSVSGQETSPQGVVFNSDGTRMFVIGDNSKSVLRYDLNIGFDIGTASFSGSSFDVSTQETIPSGVAFNSDGTRMFVIGRSSDSVHQYSLSTGFDIGTASFSGTSFSVTGQDATPSGVVFNSDGTRMFVIGRSSDSVHQYSLSTGFDIGTASFSGTSFDVLAETGNPSGVVFNSDGTRMFVIGNNPESVFQYSLGKLILQE